MKIVLSIHAKQQARERGISIDEIKKTIQQGARYVQGNKLVSDFMHIRIVHKKIKESHYIITVMIRYKQ